ncbi:MAG: hypothetical protein AAFQ87_07250 [Bacteroidota bacterium]
MKKLNFLIVALILVASSCKVDDTPIPDEAAGYNMLLIGNSFFRPYAEALDDMAAEAGYEAHQSTIVFSGGNSGRPINLWKNTGEENQIIKETLDKGDVDYFGMTAGYLPDNPTDGFREWIAYAVERNPEITVFLSIPPMDYPDDWDARAKGEGFDDIHGLYDYFINDIIHQTVVDELRAEFPSINIFSIPTGRACYELYQMQENGLLADEIAYRGKKDTSLFTDEKGHQGRITIQTGGLMWLNGLYKEDLSANTYQTGFDTDLHAIAKEIMDGHDPNYKQ